MTMWQKTLPTPDDDERLEGIRELDTELLSLSEEMTEAESPEEAMMIAAMTGKITPENVDSLIDILIGRFTHSSIFAIKNSDMVDIYDKAARTVSKVVENIVADEGMVCSGNAARVVNVLADYIFRNSKIADRWKVDVNPALRTIGKRFPDITVETYQKVKTRFEFKV